VTLCNEATADVATHARAADVIVAAAGVAHLVLSEAMAVLLSQKRHRHEADRSQHRRSPGQLSANPSGSRITQPASTHE
jgi:hypothetical protein